MMFVVYMDAGDNGADCEDFNGPGYYVCTGIRMNGPHPKHLAELLMEILEDRHESPRTH